jgi:hypothetical protein
MSTWEAMFDLSFIYKSMCREVMFLVQWFEVGRVIHFLMEDNHLFDILIVNWPITMASQY